jgi:hypothetical protein
MTVRAFGFGSYFNGITLANDLDILLVHNDFSMNSIRSALECKHWLTENFRKVDVVILSVSEEAETRFIEKCDAVPWFCWIGSP